MRRICVIRFGALGDLVLATVLLPALRSAYPGAEIWWVTKRQWAPLLAEDPRIDHLVALAPDRALTDLAAELAQVDFDLVLDAHANLRSRLLCSLLPPMPVRRLRKDSFARWLLLRGGPVLPGLRRRLVDRCLELVPESDARGARPHVVVGTRARLAASELWDDDARRVALAPGARHETKRWPTERFVEVGRELARHGHRVVVVGGPDEAEVVHAVAGAIGGAQTWPFDRSLAELAATLERCDLTVGNDSGLLHLSEAVGTPVVALFGPTVREWGYFPLDPRSRVIEQDVACRPCSKMGDRPCHRSERWCLTLSTTDQVGRAARAVLAGTE